MPAMSSGRQVRAAYSWLPRNGTTLARMDMSNRIFSPSGPRSITSPRTYSVSVGLRLMRWSSLIYLS